MNEQAQSAQIRVDGDIIDALNSIVSDIPFIATNTKDAMHYILRDWLQSHYAELCEGKTPNSSLKLSPEAQNIVNEFTKTRVWGSPSDFISMTINSWLRNYLKENPTRTLNVDDWLTDFMKS